MKNPLRKIFNSYQLKISSAVIAPSRSLCRYVREDSRNVCHLPSTSEISDGFIFVPTDIKWYKNRRGSSITKMRLTFPVPRKWMLRSLIFVNWLHLYIYCIRNVCLKQVCGLSHFPEFHWILRWTLDKRMFAFPNLHTKGSGDHQLDHYSYSFYNNTVCHFYIH